MYQFPIYSDYSTYYKDYIDRDVREFKLECDIASEAEISSINIDYDLISGAEEYTIGNLASAKLTMVVSSKVQVFETNEINLTVKLKTVTPNGIIEWVPVPLGRFYVFQTSSTKLSTTITAYDDLYKSALERIYNSGLEYPTSVHKILDEICPLLDITYDTSIPNETIERPEVVTETVYTNGKSETIKSESNQVCISMKVGQSLMYLASYLGGNFMVDGDHRLKLVTYPTTIAKSLDSTKYAPPTNDSASYDMRYIECTTYPGNIITAGFDDGIGSMALENPFMDKDRLTNILNKLNFISYKHSQVKIKGDPTLQLGDLVKIVHVSKEGIILDEQQIPILRMTFHYGGGCTNEIESPCKSVSEKAINYKGTIASRIDNLESSIDSIQSATLELYESMKALNTVRSNVDNMNLFLEQTSQYFPSTPSNNETNQFKSIHTKINDSNEEFKEEYNEIYSNKYL